MQITLNNQEINTAIEQYVRHLIALADNASMSTEITGSRGEYKVIVEILPTKAMKTTDSVETKRVGRPPKASTVIVEPKQEEVQTDTVEEEEEEVIEVLPAEEEAPTPRTKTSLFKNLNK